MGFADLAIQVGFLIFKNLVVVKKSLTVSLVLDTGYTYTHVDTFPESERW